MMAKKKKRSQNALDETSSTGAKNKPFNIKRALVILFSTAAAFIFYETLISLNFLPVGGVPIIMPIYFIIATVLICAIVFLNRGFSAKEITPDMFDDDTDPEHIKLVCKNINRQKGIARKLMLILLPFVFSIFFDMIYLFYGDFFAGALSAITGG